MHTQPQPPEVAQDGVVLHQMPGCTVTGYPDSTVIKKGRRVKLDERSALDLAVGLKLPVPRVHDSQEGSDGEASIRMDWIAGERLDLIWPNMTAEEKDGICGQLREFLTTMRSVPWTNGLIGPCSGGRARDCRQYQDYSGGPFSDEASFNTFYLDLVQTIPGPIYDALRQQLRSDHCIVFSHGDLAQHNILVQDNRITGLLDWEYAGWYPEYWDYIKFFDRPCKHQDWKSRAKKIFPQPYDSELAHHQAVVRWQRP